MELESTVSWTMTSPTAPAKPDSMLLPTKSPTTLYFAIQAAEKVRHKEVARYIGLRPYFSVSGTRTTPPTANEAVQAA